ncbi:hypothetical protein PROFUN_02092 [Planoprotostelium fungivorum]|uniref:Uncharacterized protein n=1 Tax=Planoprotostelium fungivorum TaxID=1890364 RepID=A0A2P6NZ76_9EUKA|nr:hypothetical protein PROFUN_02092 [Planoprotostelium fungivorum]
MPRSFNPDNQLYIQTHKTSMKDGVRIRRYRAYSNRRYLCYFPQKPQQRPHMIRVDGRSILPSCRRHYLILLRRTRESSLARSLNPMPQGGERINTQQGQQQQQRDVLSSVTDPSEQ